MVTSKWGVQPTRCLPIPNQAPTVIPNKNHKHNIPIQPTSLTKGIIVAKYFNDSLVSRKEVELRSPCDLYGYKGSTSLKTGQTKSTRRITIKLPIPLIASMVDKDW